MDENMVLFLGLGCFLGLFCALKQSCYKEPEIQKQVKPTYLKYTYYYSEAV